MPALRHGWTYAVRGCFAAPSGFLACIFVAFRAFLGLDSAFVLFLEIVFFGFLVGLAVLLGLEHLVGVLELVLTVFLVFLRVEHREGAGADRADREHENHDDAQPAGEFLGFESDKADHDGRDGQRDPDYVKNGLLHEAGGILSASGAQAA